MKKIYLFYKILIVLTILFSVAACRTESLEEQHTNHEHKNKNRQNVDLFQFKNETKLTNFNTTINAYPNSESLSNFNKNGKNIDIITSFKVDTTNINRLEFQENVTYSFRAYNYFESPEKIYNVVYFFKDGKWSHALLEIQKDNTSIPLYDSRFGNVSIEANNKMSGLCLAPYTTYSYHCTETGYCAGGSCDGCDLCVTVSSGTMTYECNNGGPGNGPGGGDTGGGSGGVFGDPSPYYFDPNQNLDITPEYLRASRAHYFWEDHVKPGGYEVQLWAVENSPKYNQILENYLNNYSTQNYQQNLQFHMWAIGFYMQNPSTTEEQFQNWFMETDNPSSIEMQDFLSDLNNPDIVKPTLRLKNNVRLNCIFNKAKTSANFKQYLTNFDSRFSVAHLLFDVKSLSNSTANAQTSPPDGYWIKITINSNNLNRPTLDIARTFMHEIIHAEMFRILLSLAPTSNGQIDIVQLNSMLNSQNYPGIYDYYRRFGVNNMQHEQMAAHFRGIIKNYLKQIDSSITDSQAESMAWVGLQGTVAWNNLGTTNQTNILNTYNNWYNSATRNCP